jgi:S-methylmethionine-dependent homocysteine/selenocysteine methylase
MFAQEKRVYVKVTLTRCWPASLPPSLTLTLPSPQAVLWTPEAAVEDPEAVRQLHRDVMQAFTFYASKDKLTNRGNKAGATIRVDKINREAAKLAR